MQCAEAPDELSQGPYPEMVTADTILKRSNAIRGARPVCQSTTDSGMNVLKRSNAVSFRGRREMLISRFRSLGSFFSRCAATEGGGVPSPKSSLFLSEDLYFDEPEQDQGVNTGTTTPEIICSEVAEMVRERVETPVLTINCVLASAASEIGDDRDDFSFVDSPTDDDDDFSTVNSPTAGQFPQVVVDVTATVQAQLVWVNNRPRRPQQATSSSSEEEQEQQQEQESDAQSAKEQPTDITRELPALLTAWAEQDLTASEIGELLHEYAWGRDAALGYMITNMVNTCKYYHLITHHLLWELELRNARGDTLCSAVPVGDKTLCAVAGPRKPRDNLQEYLQWSNGEVQDPSNPMLRSLLNFRDGPEGGVGSTPPQVELSLIDRSEIFENANWWEG
ncbi:hypothetical protein FE257_008322 [Aspergillus nanangensis]|uniref:Uncharacterized protein n=1 Tax=Aspergillus nanangensis TaxID=2582783 RepID=A0AAD4GTI9_ASPNN|nr:hypothetical protein FE257_008322 [Aspergillus nanangensis]